MIPMLGDPSKWLRNIRKDISSSRSRSLGVDAGVAAARGLLPSENIGYTQLLSLLCDVLYDLFDFNSAPKFTERAVVYAEEITK